MEQEAAKLSGSLIVRGIVTIIFGVAAVFWPGLTIATFVYLFAAFVLINGIIDLVFGIGRLFGGNRSVVSRVLTILLGVLQIGVGVYLIRHPLVVFATLILLVGFTFLVRGLFEVIEGIFEDASAGYKTITIIGGLLAILAGIILLFQPVAGGVAFVWILGVYALITGPLLIALAIEVKNSVKPVTGKAVKA